MYFQSGQPNIQVKIEVPVTTMNKVEDRYKRSTSCLCHKH